MSLDPSLRRALAFPAPRAALGAGVYVESDHASVRAVSERVTAGCSGDVARAVACFRFVRDAIAYEFLAKLRPEPYHAHAILEAGRGFCVQKAVLLVSLLRASAVPAAIVSCDLRDHTMPKRIVSAMGTDVMHWHGMVAVYVGDRWCLVDPSHDAGFAERKGYHLTEWTGSGDALIATTTPAGEGHAEYTALHGIHLDLPFEHMMASFARAYADVDVVALAEAGVRVGG